MKIFKIKVKEHFRGKKELGSDIEANLYSNGPFD